MALPVIYIAEDDPADLLLLRETLEMLDVRNPLQIFPNGNEAITFFKQLASAPGAAPQPGLLFLDLHLPQIDGCGVVAWLKRQPFFSKLRIVVVSGSGDSKDVSRVLALGANRTLEKPATKEALTQEITRLNDSFRLASEKNVA